MKKIKKLFPPLLLKTSREFLQKAQNPRSSHAGLTVYLDSAFAAYAAELLCHYEGMKLESTGILTSSFLGATLQKIKSFGMILRTGSQPHVTEFLKKMGKADHMRLEGYSSSGLVAGQARLMIHSYLDDVVEIAFDAEKYKYAFGLPDIFPRSSLGEGVFENKDRYTAAVIEEFKNIIHYLSISEEVQFLQDAMMDKLTKITEEALQKAEELNIKSYKIIINIVNGNLFRLIGNENTSIPVLHALRKLGMFSEANNLDSRMEGAEGQIFQKRYTI